MQLLRVVLFLLTALVSLGAGCLPEDPAEVPRRPLA